LLVRRENRVRYSVFFFLLFLFFEQMGKSPLQREIGKNQVNVPNA
jgi:hypothetical protein